MFVCVERHWVMAIHRLCMVVRVHVHITWFFLVRTHAIRSRVHPLDDDVEESDPFSLTLSLSLRCRCSQVFRCSETHNNIATWGSVICPSIHDGRIHIILHELST